MIYSSFVPLNFLGEVALVAIYLTNQTPSSVLFGTCPYEKLFQIKPNLSSLKFLCCTSFVLLLEHGRNLHLFYLASLLMKNYFRSNLICLLSKIFVAHVLFFYQNIGVPSWLQNLPSVFF